MGVGEYKVHDNKNGLTVHPGQYCGALESVVQNPGWSYSVAAHT